MSKSNWKVFELSEELKKHERTNAPYHEFLRVPSLSWDQEGAVTETHAYHHFHAYIQARRGGLISFSFPELFWNIPVRVREEAGIPKPGGDSEWIPELYDEESVGYYYDYVLVRRHEKRPGVESFENFPYDRIYSNPPWEVYRRRASADTE